MNGADHAVLLLHMQYSQISTYLLRQSAMLENLSLESMYGPFFEPFCSCADVDAGVALSGRCCKASAGSMQGI
jgi:hypothetical protein